MFHSLTKLERVDKLIPDHYYFLPKNDIIFPCPGFPPAFLPLLISDAVDAGVFSLCRGGSSSENDSHAGSSFVTMDEAG